MEAAPSEFVTLGRAILNLEARSRPVPRPRPLNVNLEIADLLFLVTEKRMNGGQLTAGGDFENGAGGVVASATKQCRAIEIAIRRLDERIRLFTIWAHH
jgi:hypothetical protein